MKIDVMDKHLVRLYQVVEKLIMVVVVAKRAQGIGSALPSQL